MTRRLGESDVAPFGAGTYRFFTTNDMAGINDLMIPVGVMIYYYSNRCDMLFDGSFEGKMHGDMTKLNHTRREKQSRAEL